MSSPSLSRRVYATKCVFLAERWCFSERERKEREREHAEEQKPGARD